MREKQEQGNYKRLRSFKNQSSNSILSINGKLYKREGEIRVKSDK